MPTQTGDQFASYPPSTFDRADGLNGRPGTPTSIGDFMVNTSLGNSQGGYFFEEEPDSPEIERAEQGTIVHKFRCDPQTALTLIATIGRGYTFEDSFGFTSRCVNSRLTYNKGLICGIQITCESLNWDWPPDEFSLDVVELNPAIEKHPRYGQLNYQDRRWVHGSVDAEGIEFQSMYDAALNSIIPPGSIPTQDQQVRYQQAKELAFKLHKGEDSFYLPGFRISYSQYFSIPVPLNPGGYIQDPILSGALPYYFWNTDTPQTNNTNNTIFSVMAALNPTIYNTGISWLRLCDTIQYQRTWFRVTSQWQGGPLGNWDQQIYTVPELPYQTSETQGSVILPGGGI